MGWITALLPSSPARKALSLLLAAITIALIGIAVTIHARMDDWKLGQR